MKTTDEDGYFHNTETALVDDLSLDGLTFTVHQNGEIAEVYTGNDVWVVPKKVTDPSLMRLLRLLQGMVLRQHDDLPRIAHMREVE